MGACKSKHDDTEVNHLYTGGEGVWDNYHLEYKSNAPEEVTSAEIDPSVKKIGRYAFYKCDKLKTIVIPTGVEVVGYFAFGACNKLTKVELPSTLKKIEADAFQECESLTAIRVPEGTEEIGKEAFYCCYNLKKVELPSTLQRIGKRAFIACHSLQTLTLPFISDVFENDLFKDHKSLERVTFFSHPDTLEVEQLEGNTPLHLCIAKDYPLTFIDGVIKGCPKAVRQRNTLGQTPLHLCLSNKVSAEVTKLIYDAWPDAVLAKNELSKTPLDYWRENGGDEEIGNIIKERASTTTAVAAFLLRKDKTVIVMDGEPVLLRGQNLLLEVVNEHNDEIYKNLLSLDRVPFRKLFLEQLHSRSLLFDKLLTEFSKLIDFSNKKVIQRAAATQALCPTYLTASNKKHIDFGCFPSAALWYQQEILSLVMRVYCEDQLMDDLVGRKPYVPSALLDAYKCKKDLMEKTQTPSNHRIHSFTKLTNFLTEGLKEGDYDFQGPVVKPLQSLFNKVYIRRGQTAVDIVGDMTRATLLIKNKSDLSAVVSKLEERFPEMNGKVFEGPDKIGVNAFLHKVFNMKKIPDTNIIPYRLKANSSQKKRIDNKEPALLFNFNFFDVVPEYHRVGSTEMCVAFELQIGLEIEVSGLREDHLAYEEGRILKAQPLLKGYKEAQENINHVERITTSLSPSSVKTSEDHNDLELISSVLEGNFSNCKYRELGKKEIVGEGMAPIAPKRLCLNNKRLNIWANQDKAVILDGPFVLDPSKRYSVDSTSFKMEGNTGYISVGLFANFGPYIVQISALFVGDHPATEISLIKPGVNFLSMESISMLPPKCNGVVLVAWGDPHYKVTWADFKECYYQGMKLVLNQYEEVAE